MMEGFDGVAAGVVPVKPIDVSSDKLEKLRDTLKSEFETALNDREWLMKKCKVWVTQYNARTKRKEAGPTDSNLDMPITREMLKALMSRIKNPIIQEENTFVSIPRRPEFEDIARNTEEQLDFIFDKIDVRHLTDQWLTQGFVFPAGFVKAGWVRETKTVKRWVDITDGIGEMAVDEAVPDMVVMQKVGDQERYFIEEERDVVVREGVYPEVVPFEDFIFPSYSESLQSAPWVCHRVWLSKEQIAERIARGMYDKRSPGADKDTLEQLGEGSQAPDRLFSPAGSSDKEQPEGKAHEVLEFYKNYDPDGKGKPIEVVVTILRESGLVLRAVNNWYHNHWRPFIKWVSESVPGSVYGTPATFILEPLQRAYSGSINQRLDAGLRNSQHIVLYSDPELDKVFRGGALRGGAWRVGGGFENIKDKVFEFSLSPKWNQLDNLEGIIKQHAEMVMSISPYNLGQEEIQRPTATGQIHLIEEARQPLYDVLEAFRTSMSELAMMALSRYKQYYPAGLEVFQRLNPEARHEVSYSFIEWSDAELEESVLVETKVSSGTMNKQLRKTEKQAFVEKAHEVYDTLAGYYTTAVQDPTVGPIMLELGRAYQTFWGDMLKEFDVPNIDKVNPDLSEAVNLGAQIKQLVDSLYAQIDELGQQNAALIAEMGAAEGAGEGAPVPGNRERAGGGPGQAAPNA